MIRAKIRKDNSVHVKIDGDLNTIIYELRNIIYSIMQQVSLSDISWYLKQIDEFEKGSGERDKITEHLLIYLADYKTKFLKEKKDE